MILLSESIKIFMTLTLNKTDVLWISVSFLRLKTHLTSHPPQDVLSPEEYSKVRNEYKQSQIQAKKERSYISAEEEERPPGEEEPADNGKDSVTHFFICDRRFFSTDVIL